MDSAGCHTGGRCEIRTREELAPLPVFKTGAFNRSANLPFADCACRSWLRHDFDNVGIHILASGACAPTNPARWIRLGPPSAAAVRPRALRYTTPAAFAASGVLVVNESVACRYACIATWRWQSMGQRAGQALELCVSAPKISISKRVFKPASEYTSPVATFSPLT